MINVCTVGTKHTSAFSKLSALISNHAGPEFAARPSVSSSRLLGRTDCRITLQIQLAQS